MLPVSARTARNFSCRRSKIAVYARYMAWYPSASEASSFVLKGHCYPGSKDLTATEPGQYLVDVSGSLRCGSRAVTKRELAADEYVTHPHLRWGARVVLQRRHEGGLRTLQRGGESREEAGGERHGGGGAVPARTPEADDSVTGGLMRPGAPGSRRCGKIWTRRRSRCATSRKRTRVAAARHDIHGSEQGVGAPQKPYCRHPPTAAGVSETSIPYTSVS